MRNWVAKNDFNRASTHEDKTKTQTRPSSRNLMEEALEELENEQVVVLEGDETYHDGDCEEDGGIIIVDREP